MGFAKAVDEAGLPAVDEKTSSGRFDILALADAIPDKADAVIADHYLTRRDFSSSRLIRTLRPVPPHFHRSCDEYVLILRGAGTAWLEDPRNEAPFHAGHLLFFARGTIHCMPRIIDGPVLALSVDTPIRDAGDLVFVDRAGRPISSDRAGI